MPDERIGKFAELIQAAIVGLIAAIIFDTFISTLPDSFLTAPIKELVSILNALPWIFVILGVLALLSMIMEMIDL